MGIRAVERSVRIVAWLWGESVSIANNAKCGLVFWRVERKLFIIQRHLEYWPRRNVSTIDGKWFSRADISFAEVSSSVDSCRIRTSVFAQEGASIVGKSD